MYLVTSLWFLSISEEPNPSQPEDGDEEEGVGHHKSPRFTKAQARQRFKKGKT